MIEIHRAAMPGDIVVLGEAPQELLDGSAKEDQDAIFEIPGKTVRLNE